MEDLRFWERDKVAVSEREWFGRVFEGGLMVVIGVYLLRRGYGKLGSGGGVKAIVDVIRREKG